jgi:hypothetical protein
MPSWYDQAQQNVVNQATANSANVPQLQNTVAGQAINNLSGPNNPFSTAQTGLNSILSGAATPWITNANGTVSPNTSTALGGLAASEQQSLNTALPQVTSQAGAGGTATGQFGSLRGQTAQENAIGTANAAMDTALNQAALQNQQTGVSAATGLGNVGSQGTTAETTLGQAQQASPLQGTVDLANILNTINAPTTTTQTQVASPLNVLSALAGQSGSATGSLGSITSGLGSLISGGSNLLSGLFSDD